MQKRSASWFRTMKPSVKTRQAVSAYTALRDSTTLVFPSRVSV